MAKWHNGPKGPGICRAKSGNCPFGGAESHFDSKAEAEESFDEQNAEKFGVLPGMNEGEDTKETEITASNDRGVPLSLSNYVLSSGKGSQYQTDYFNDKLESANMDYKKMLNSLRNDDQIKGEWGVKSYSEDEIILQNRDVFGNMSEITVNRFEPEVKEPEPGRIFAASSRGIPMSLSNYVQKGDGGSREAEAIFEMKIADANLDSAKMLKNLNGDKRVNGKWSLAEEDDDEIKLKNVDVFGGVDYITITKN